MGGPVAGCYLGPHSPSVSRFFLQDFSENLSLLHKEEWSWNQGHGEGVGYLKI